jgi:PAS domain S-box-containing protein
MDNAQTKKAKGNLLVVDDDLFLRQAMDAFLTREGYEVRCAPNGQTALLFAGKDPPDLILLDIRLPDMDGFQVCRRLKGDPQTSNIPVIFISGLDDVSDKVKGFEAGGVDYITKSFQRGELLARVETHLALRRLQKQIEAQNAQLQQEISKSRQAEVKIKQAAEEWETTFNSIKDPVSVHDKDFGIVKVNKAFAEASGMKAEELIGKKCYEIIHALEEPWPNCPHRETLGCGKAVTEEFLEPRLGKYLQVSASPICNDQNEVIGSVHIAKDITERKRAEEALTDRTVQLERINRELVALNAELDDFTNMASHDMQEPLRTLVAFSDLLRKDLGDSLPEQAEKDLAFITDAAKRMQALIQDLLELSRAGRAGKKREKVSLRECADLALQALAMRVKETEAQIVRDELPDVWGDSTLLKQLYQNLIGNALKFSGGQPPIIHLTFEEQEGTPVFGVKDNGIGIEPKYAREIFKPFRRLHGRAAYEGSGVGLAICRKIVDRHGGKIWVESEPGKGAHFRFAFSQRTKER